MPLLSLTDVIIAVQALQTQSASLEASVSLLQSDSSDHEARLDGHDGDIADHETRLTALERAMTAVNDATNTMNTAIEAVQTAVAAHGLELDVHEQTIGRVDRKSVSPFQEKQKTSSTMRNGMKNRTEKIRVGGRVVERVVKPRA